MKNKIYILYFLIFFFIIAGNTAFSQFTITSHYIPIIGDTLKTSEVDTTGLNPGEAGINKIWDFSNINILPGSPWEEVYLVPSSTPYSSQFPNANVATKNNNPSPDYHYYQNTTSEWNMVGYANNNFLKWFTTPYCRFHYPMTYGSQYNSTYNAYNYSGQATRFSTGFRSFIVDGSGTIILPSSTYNNVLRVKVIDESFDTVKQNGVVLSTGHTIITNYWWYREGYKFPVFDFGYAESNIMYNFKFASIQVKNVPVNINIISSSVPDKFELSQNYPNPFNPKTIIRFKIKDSRFVTLKIFDSSGKEVVTLINEKLCTGTYEVPFSADQLSSGVYFYRLNAGDFTDTKKMIIIK